MQPCSPKPYLLRALYEWCSDQGYTPYIVVHVDAHTRVPRAFVRDGKIILNISFDATDQLKMNNDWIEFNARFSGKSHKLEIPVSNVLAIYAHENGQGMSFPAEAQPSCVNENEESSDTAADESAPGASGQASSRFKPARTTGKKRGAHLKLIK
ncbi:Stringent starvation protein B [Candidatus Glomeribacter gigasporarum BEG34]|uniref:Stringent starvation protein B n=1 Tax=Candidatus Glomeribacter gigasporarum BEG34 TaxID=1070319 RepID=G2J7H7_9BURK|nr:ClpXP protease specificity-enhancing factor [Candidatus Glomeribacter gigasporarum]CCD28722.1 Stringent starvation protein B [Candidatus Glomeribacter gigasporarum BEG34]